MTLSLRVQLLLSFNLLGKSELIISLWCIYKMSTHGSNKQIIENKNVRKLSEIKTHGT